MKIHKIHRCGDELHYNTLETPVKLGHNDVVVVVSDCHLKKLGAFTIACFDSDGHGHPYLCAPLSTVWHVVSSGTDDFEEANKLLELVCDQLKQARSPFICDAFNKAMCRVTSQLSHEQNNQPYPRQSWPPRVEVVKVSATQQPETPDEP